MNTILQKRFLSRATLISIALLYLCTGAVFAAEVTGGQKAKLRQFARRYQQESTRLRQHVGMTRAKLAQQYLAPRIDTSAATNLMNELSQTQNSLLLLHLRNQIDIRQLLSKDQFEGFVEELSDFKHRRQRKGRNIEDGLFNRRMLDSLGLSGTQQNKLKNLSALLDKRDAQTAELNSNTQKLMARYQVYNLDVAQARVLVSLVHKNQRSLAELSHRVMLLLHSVLTKDQMEQVLPQMFGEQGGRRQGRQRGG